MADKEERASHGELARLVRAAQGGDRDAFEKLYGLTAQIQYFSLLGKVGPEAAPDILQDLYLIAWENLPKVKPRAFVAYLNATARNLCRDYFKRQGGTRAPSPVDDEALEAVAHERSGAAAEAANPETVVGARDEQARLARALRDDLDDRERDAVLLRYCQNLKLYEVADALGVSQATAKRTLASALDKLRAKLGVLPVGAALGDALTAAMESTPAPTLSTSLLGPSAPGTARPDGPSRAWGIAAIAITLAAVLFAFAVPREVLPSGDSIPSAQPEPVSETIDDKGPSLVENRIEGDITVFVLSDDSSVVEAWCVSGDGRRAEAQEGSSFGAMRGEWRFLLDSGTWELHAMDGAGNESMGTLQVDITPDAFGRDDS